MELDPHAILAETLKDLEDSIESQARQLESINQNIAQCEIQANQLRLCRDNLILIRGRLASKLPA